MNSKMKIQIKELILAVILCFMTAAVSAQIRPIENIGALMPKHGTVSIEPAKNWDDGLAEGNGNMGAMLYGNPVNETLLVNHCKLWLPAGSREVLPNIGDLLPEMRKIIGEKGYEEGQNFFLKKAMENGWGGILVWTDVFHPGFFLNINQPERDKITDYARVENFSTGEVWVQWKTNAGDFSRRMFVSKTDNTIVLKTSGPKGLVSLNVTMQKLGNKLIDSKITVNQGWITCHNIYIKGKGGYDGAIRIINDGGIQTIDSTSVSVKGASSVTMLMRILPWRTPLLESQAWLNDPTNPDFAGNHIALRKTVQITGKAYEPKWMDELKADLKSMPVSYNVLFKSHSAAWSKLFDRVSIDLGGDPTQRAMSSEVLLALAKREKRLPIALLERMYDAGRYVYMCTAGTQTPPNLFGIWSGTWTPEWSGDYTTDTNLQLDTELAYSANLAEGMKGYFYLWNSFIPDLRRNAKSLYGCRGILLGSRASNNGLDLHWDKNWPGNLWTPGASWLAHWYYDYYQYTGDKKFLREQAIPFMKECALFWEDFLKGTEDANGHYTFRPSFSAENGTGDNSSQDIEITHELFTNLITGCETLGIEKEHVIIWKAMLAKMPPLLINAEGQLKEWSNPNQGEKNNHRHLMHLYGAFESMQFSEEADPVMFEAAKIALLNRIKASTEDATHGFMHTGLAAVGLGMGDLAFSRIEILAKRQSIFSNMVDGHFGGPRLLCVDGNGSTPEIVNRMLVQSCIGSLSLLPALPDKILRKGDVKGLKAHGQLSINQLTWDMTKGICSATITSSVDQIIKLVMPRDMIIKYIMINKRKMPVTEVGVKKYGTVFSMQKGKTMLINVSFTPNQY
jgi:hypothetical protein